MQLTQKEMFQVSEAKVEAFYYYGLFCYETKEAPRKDMLNMIEMCRDKETLKKFSKIYQSKMIEFLNEKY